MQLEDIIRLKQKLANDPYVDTGTESPPEVKQAIQRWKDLPENKRKETPLLYWLLGSGTPPYKMSQEETGYTNNSEVEGRTCKNCEFAYLKMSNKKFICSQIRGEIKPSGWCKLWKPQKK